MLLTALNFNVFCLFKRYEVDVLKTLSKKHEANCMDPFLLCVKRYKRDTPKLKLFKRYVNDIVCTIKGNPLNYLERSNSLYIS